MSKTEVTPAENVSRRSVVRVGANAAWAVPAIAIATAAPALAVSGAHAVVTTSGSGTLSSNKKTGTFTVTFSNASGTAATQGLAFTISPVSPSVFVSASMTSTGWTASGSGQALTFTRTGAQILAGGTLQVVFAVTKAVSHTTFGINVAPTVTSPGTATGAAPVAS